MAKTGRPSIYTPKLAKAICDRMAGGESLRSICRDKDMPNRSTVTDWAFSHPEFSSQYEEARQKLLEYWSHEIIEIADDGTNDWQERQNKNGDTYDVPRPELVMRSRLRVDARKWVMSKLAPKKYGDSTQVNVSVKGEISHIHKTDAQILEDLESVREKRRKRVLNKRVSAPVSKTLPGTVNPVASSPIPTQ